MQGAMMRLVMTQNLTSLMIVTLGLGYVLQGGSALIFGGNPQTLPGTLARAKIDLGPLWFTWQDVLVLVVHAAAVRRGVAGSPRTHALRLGHSRGGRGSQARASCSASMRKVVYLCVFVFECAAVALGAALVAPRSPILTSMGFNEVIMTFVVVVLGGIGSIGGALAAGLGLGLFTAFFGAFVAHAYTTAAAFALLLALLVVRPRGIGGEMTAIESSPARADAAIARCRCRLA